MRLYDHLFKIENPEAGGDDFIQQLNPDSLNITLSAKLEPSLGKSEKGRFYQFLRVGYFCLDTESKQEKLIFNRTVGLRDNWVKKQ